MFVIPTDQHFPYQYCNFIIISIVSLILLDLDTTSQTINISSSQTQAQVCINITDDNIYESLETYTVQLSVIDVLSSIEDGVVLTNPVSLVPQGRLVIGTNSVSRVTIMDDDSMFYCSTIITVTVRRYNTQTMLTFECF